ncbi:hypothetical protein C1645_854712 [Glomus cerebriforme]|uniref:F-box domain-containing protein n=1 Tax=Glomus cerebriforme TaxID=658196 RepID=A0A397SXC7_9GLOM|nr:hypothetical protein C1645_854712 [Glomus cerebriforme]
MSQALINEVGNNKFQEEYKRNLLKQEIYKLFINNCKNIKYFYWKTEQPLFQYPGAIPFFSKLCALGINLQLVTSTALFEMAQICQNVEDLDLHDCNGDIPGLIKFIDIQRNLQSLHLYFNNVEKQCIQLSDVIQRKAATLKKFTLAPTITLLSPKFLPSLVNLQYLVLNDERYGVRNEIVEIEEWEKYLSISSFPNLQYLETANLPPPCKDYTLIEKSNGNILEIYIYRECQDIIYTKKLLKMITKYCPKIERLTINVEPENFDEIKEMFLNCKQLIKLHLSTHNGLFVCDSLLEIVAKYSPLTLREFSFDENWNFSVNGLQDFFESWKSRIPLKFSVYYNERSCFMEEHTNIVKKYRNEGIIR